MLPSPSYSYLRLMETAAERDRSPRHEREVDDLQRELAFATRPAIVAESPAPRRLRLLKVALRAILVPLRGLPAASDGTPEP